METAKPGKNPLYAYLLPAGLAALFALAWGSFVFTPVTGDLKVFLAGAHQARYISGDLIIGAFKAWELKSVASRLLMVFIYRIATLFVPYGTYAFEVVSKALYSLMMIPLLYAAVRIVYGKDRRKVLTGTGVVSVLFMAMHTGCQMQAEMTASVLVLLAFALYLSAVREEKRRLLKLLAAGALIGTVFYLKSVLILLSVSVVAAVCIYAKEKGTALSLKRMMTVAGGSVLALAVIGGLILLINPAEFRDMLDASAFQKTLLSSRIYFKTVARLFFSFHAEKLLFIPGVLIGLLCLLLNLAACIREKKGSTVFFHLAMWAMPALFIALSNNYFVYHADANLFPAAAEILLVTMRGNRILKMIPCAAAGLAAVWYVFMFSVVSAPVRTYLDLDRQAYEKTEAFLESVGYEQEEPALYLDDGTGGYALGNPSHLKYFFPLPLQRLEEGSDLACHTESLEKAMAFEGKYISIYEDWFFDKNEYPALREKIRSEYEKIGEYAVFCPPFSLSAGDAYVRSMDLYRRKE